MRKILFGTVAAIVIGTAMVSAAPRTTAPSTIALSAPVLTTTDGGSSGSTIWPALGDSVTFSVTYPKSVEKYGPRIQVMCYQGDMLVYGEAGPYYQAFMLGGAGSIWVYSSPGPAHCVADLYYWSYQGGQKFNWLASVEFDAGA